MPNWTWNKIVCKKQLLDKILDKTDNGYSFDFNKLIPMPKTLNLTSGSIEEEAVACYYLSLNKTDRTELYDELNNTSLDFYRNYWKKYKSTIEYFQSNPDKLEETKKNFANTTEYKSEKIKSLKELGKLYVFNIKNYGSSEWYDWCYEKWGTKWNVLDDVSVNYNKSSKKYEIEFNTAWCVPYGIVDAYSNLCKDNDFHWEYIDEDDDTHFCLIKRDGVILKSLYNQEKEVTNDERET